jgi:hypothetical protein
MIRYISLSSLCKRGWTPKLVETLLGQPIARQRNPYFPVKGAQMLCFQFR